MKISILHPFTPEAVGLKEADLPAIHSQPHLKAMQKLSGIKGYGCAMDYFTRKGTERSFQDSNIKYRFFPVNFKWNGDHKKWKKQRSGRCLKEYRKNTPDVTIINMSGHSSPFSFELAQIIRRNKKQYIAMLGGQHYSDNERNRWYYKNAHHILVHTHSQKKEMEDMELFQDTDIRIFPLGVDISLFAPDKKVSASPSLLYVGRIVEWKRIHIAIEAVKFLKNKGFVDTKLKIIGPTSSKSYKEDLERLIEEYQLQENVLFLGAKNNTELVSYYQQADLFTLPSDLETFGMVMTEAMSCGTPVAAIDCPGGPKEVISHGINGILTTTEKYAEEIFYFFQNENYALDMARSARERIEAEYSLEATYKALENSIDSVLK